GEDRDTIAAAECQFPAAIATVNELSSHSGFFLSSAHQSSVGRDTCRTASLTRGTSGGATLRERTPNFSNVGTASNCPASSPQIATGVSPASSTTMRTSRKTAG